MTARNHHYLPQCYLRGFVRDPKKPRLFVVDFRERTSFLTNPRNVASRRDFNRVELSGYSEDAIEKALSAFESELAAALERIRARGSIDDDEDRAYLLNLVGLAAVRTPRFRNANDSFQKRVMRMMLEIVTNSPDRWEAAKRGARKSGFLKGADDLSFEEAQRLLEPDAYEIDIPETRHIIMELETFEKILPTIFQRNWQVARIHSDEDSFITSDQPLYVGWKSSEYRGDQLHPPGIGMLDTYAIFPISSKLALVGEFEETRISSVFSRWQTARLNADTLLNARRQIYAQDDLFSYIIGNDFIVRTGRDLVNDGRLFDGPRNSDSE